MRSFGMSEQQVQQVWVGFRAGASLTRVAERSAPQGPWLAYPGGGVPGGRAPSRQRRGWISRHLHSQLTLLDSRERG